MSCKYNTPGCKNCHATDRGACNTYEQGRNGMCVYCDHLKDCHAFTDGKNFNTPLGVEISPETLQSMLASESKAPGWDYGIDWISGCPFTLIPTITVDFGRTYWAIGFEFLKWRGGIERFTDNPDLPF